MRKVFIIISAPQMYGFVQGHAQRLLAAGYQTVIVSSKSDSLTRLATADGARVLTVPIERDISPFNDLCTFVRLCFLILREKPDAVMSMGPKANLLGNISGWIMEVPRRISLYVGIRQETMKGFSAALIDLCDKVALAAATYILAISSSLRLAMITRKLARAERIFITGNGTTNGIPAEHFPFNHDAFISSVELRAKLEIPPYVPVIGFIGRITEDKGFLDIIEVYQRICDSKPNTHLILVGQYEVKTSEGRTAFQKILSNPQVHIVGAVADVRPYIHLFWLHLFPSYREGFGNATVEAAALAVPTVGYLVTGVMDAISQDITGIMVNFREIEKLTEATLHYINSLELRTKHGLKARQRTLSLYHPDTTWAGYLPAFELPSQTSAHISEKYSPVVEYIDREELLLRTQPEEVSRLKQALACGALSS